MKRTQRLRVRLKNPEREADRQMERKIEGVKYSTIQND